MMELQTRPQFRTVIPPNLLQEGYLVYFPTTWPSTYKYVTGKLFRIDVALQVPYELAYILPAGDFRDVDFSNDNAAVASNILTENIYPENAISMFETTVGFMEGHFISEFFIPAGTSRHRLEFAQMEPDITNAKRLFLGAFTAKDSPFEDPKFKFYSVKDFTPLIMRLFVLAGIDFEKITVSLIINRCKLNEIKDPTKEQMDKAKVIRYYDELKW